MMYIIYIYIAFMFSIYSCAFLFSILFYIDLSTFHLTRPTTCQTSDDLAKFGQLLRHLIHVGLTVDFVDSIASCCGRKCCHVLLRGTVCVCVCVSLGVSVCVRVCVRVCVWLASWLPACLSVSVCLSLSLTVCLPVCLCLSVSVCLSLSVSVCLSVCLCLSVSLCL